MSQTIFSLDLLVSPRRSTAPQARPQFLGAAVLALFLSGCASTATMEPADADTWRDAQRKVLAERAEARWDALIKRDYAAAYEYLSPAYRGVVTLQQYQAKFGRVLEWRLARAKDIHYDSPTLASVSVEVSYRVSPPGVSGEMVDTSKEFTEKWLYKDGGWWYTAQ